MSQLQRFRHNDLSHLALLLEKHTKDNRPKFIIIESIYSMDGDQVDLEKVILLAKKYRAFLYVDDAHAVGVYGKSGFGKAAEYAKDIDMIMGTFSKALGSSGAYIACSNILRDYLINKCRGLIYSTAISPAIIGAMDAAWEITPTLCDARVRIKNYASRLRNFFKEHQLDYGTSDTHIVPWIIGDAEKTLQISRLLQRQGILGATIRPPSVPVGKSRIRFCLTARHTEEDFMRLLQAIRNTLSSIIL
jgi:8-amino-7-oxononanoate synthase